MDIGERFMNSVVFVTACLRIWVLVGNMHARGVVSMFDAWCFVSVVFAKQPIYVFYLQLTFAALWLGLHAESTCHR